MPGAAIPLEDRLEAVRPGRVGGICLLPVAQALLDPLSELREVIAAEGEDALPDMREVAVHRDGREAHRVSDLNSGARGPSRISLKVAQDGMLRCQGLLVGVVDRRDDAVAVSREPARSRVKCDAAPLHLKGKQTELRMSDQEVELAVGLASRPMPHHAMEDGELVRERGLEARKDLELGTRLVAERSLREHPRHLGYSSAACCGTERRFTRASRLHAESNRSQWASVSSTNSSPSVRRMFDLVLESACGVKVFLIGIGPPCNRSRRRFRIGP